MRILVLGYYHRHNLGDDAFEEAIPIVIGKEHQYRFVVVDNIEKEEADRDPNDHYDMILLGGGDVVNKYFFVKVNPLVSRFHRGPFVLFGAGITWQSCISLGHLDQFDRVFLRNTTDLRCAERRLGTEFAHFLPDLVFSLCPHRPCPTQLAEQSVKTDNGSVALIGDTLTESADECEPLVRVERPKASFYLIQSIDRAKPDNAERQQFVLKRLAQCVEYAAQTHTVFLVRFNTCGTRDGDDLHISQTVYSLCSKQAQEHIFVDSTAYRSPQAMLQQMSSMDVNVCMRFHSHVFSTIQQVPFVSLMLTRKVEMLVDELGLEARCGVRLPRDEESRQPLDVPFDQFCERFDYVVEHSDELRDYLRRAYEERHALLKSGVVGKLLANTSIRPGRKLLPVGDTNGSAPSDDKESFLDTLVEKASAWWEKRLGFSLLSRGIDRDDAESSSSSDSSSTIDTGAKRKRRRRTTRGRSVESKSRTLVLSNTDSERRVRHHVNTVCQRLCYSVTDEIQPKFMYGFVENMMRDPFRVREYLKWIMEERERQRTEQGDMRRFHLDFMQQQDFAGAHRSGWSFAASHLRALHSDRGVLFDTCMDRTFHWGCDALRHGGVLPYTHSWCGIVHHTPSTDYTDYNTTAMLANPLFRESLLTCRGIYVLSDSLKTWFDKALAELPMTKVPPVCVLKHPTEVPSRNNRFTMRRFRANRDKKLLHVGAWLRDTFAIYRIALLDEASRAVARAEYNHAVSIEVPRTRLRRYRKDGAAAQSKGFIIIDGKKHSLRRCMLRGPNMSLYLPPAEESLLVTVKRGDGGCSCCAATEKTECSAADGKCTGCRHNCGDEAVTMSQSVAGGGDSRSREDGESKETKCTNKWTLGLRQFATDEILSGVDIIERLDNAAYDETLCENIVFLNLVDASACNTLIECLVRNTPILINRLPAVEEVLGKDYPFYYESLEEALVKSRCYESVCAAHRHLKAIDKTPYRIESFINDVRDSAIYRGL